MVNYSDQVAAFIGFKVAVMGPFGLVWVIITFMHDLRWQCRTRKTWLKFNHFLIYVFMQELTVDGHEWNNTMRPGLVWYPRSVQLLCRTCHIWDRREIYCFTQLAPDPETSCFDRFSSTPQMHVCNSLQCIKDVFWNYTWGFFLYFIVTSTGSYIFRVLRLKHLMVNNL